MNHRERMYKAEHFQKPDRIPLTFGVYGGLVIREGQEIANLLGKYDFDNGVVDLQADEKGRQLDPDYYKEDVDEWGVGWKHIKEGHLGQTSSHPLLDWNSLSDYRLPPGPPEIGSERFKKQKEEVGRKKLTNLVGMSAETMGGLCFFERLQWLRGYENLMFDIADLAPQLYELADLIIEWNRKWVIYGVALGADQICFADDWGTQTQLMIDPKIWRKFFKPRYARMFEPALSAGVQVHLHSDGVILEILEDLIEIGATSFRPQFSCYRLEDLARITWGRAAIHADIDRQYVMPYGTVDEVRNLVKRIIDLFGHPDGGLIGPGEAMHDVPMANVKAALDAWVYYGGEYWNERRLLI
ncbi:MAG: uroporphyrinogen decarboxylase family protein [Clostridiales bacterium]|nr:uroporphyrinogen decarboxylase family protein [Clostridiales bacterium]